MTVVDKIDIQVSNINKAVADKYIDGKDSS
jgi:hypothetical protein